MQWLLDGWRAFCEWMTGPNHPRLLLTRGHMACAECGSQFPVSRPVSAARAWRGRAVLCDHGYRCFTGVDGLRHHLVVWRSADPGEEREIACGWCGFVVPLPAAPAGAAGAAEYECAGFGCPRKKA